MSNGKVKTWRKVLHERCGYPDNYTPEQSFLAAIQKNKDVRMYSLHQCLSGAAAVGQEISLVLIFWCCYQYLKLNIVAAERLLSVLLAAAAAGYAHFMLAVPNVSAFRGLTSAAVFTTTGYSLSPVLYRLTDTVSTDTIHTMAVLGLLLHLLTMDYGLNVPVVSRTVSLNAAIFSAVCLASRFTSHFAAFTLLCLAVFSFLLIPLSQPARPPPAPPTSALLGASAVALLSGLSLASGTLAVVTLAAVQIVFPVLFHSLQQFKSTIHGPWDEAVLHSK